MNRIMLQDMQLEKSLGKSPMTEHACNFIEYTPQVTRGKAAPQELKVGGEFYASTENRTQFVAHVVKPRERIEPSKYVPSTYHMETKTTHSENYQDWHVKPVQKRQHPKWHGNSEKFQGESTAKTDFIVQPLPVPFVRVREEYHKSNVPMETETTQAASYKFWKTTARTPHSVIPSQPPF